jgi:hypothetical protein
LHAHRWQRQAAAHTCCALPVNLQVFKTFADGFGEAYKPLLTEIQQAFDASIQQGLQDSLENITLRQDAATAEVIFGQSPAATACVC